MRASDPLNAMSKAIVNAVERDLPDIERETPRRGKFKVRPSESSVQVYQFPQVWGTTALGFDGSIAGQAMTTADTTVVSDGQAYAVYFAGKFAYLVTRPNEKFLEDLRSHNMAPVARHSQYER